ncbi:MULTISPECIES: hypothetical protein [unclassified Streptomyces]|uniref:hypothetical protein n=1 Tax=unclassified Streptomyces TaxID=2593676 RepID=UPI002E225B3C|nr:hypothetical protein OG217_06640 [Streptomyces sp. NBC_01023]
MGDRQLSDRDGEMEVLHFPASYNLVQHALIEDNVASGYGAVGSVLAAYLAVTLLATAPHGAGQRRDRRGCERVLIREETLGSSRPR